MRIFASFCLLVFKKKSSQIFSISGDNFKNNLKNKAYSIALCRHSFTN